MESILPYLTATENHGLLDSLDEFSIHAIPTKFRTVDTNPYYTVTVSRRGKDSWAVIYQGRVYSKSLTPRSEGLPSSRTEAFLKRYRFTLLEAVALAEKLAPTVSMRGVTAADIIKHKTWFDAYAAVTSENEAKAAKKADKAAHKAAKDNTVKDDSQTTMKKAKS